MYALNIDKETNRVLSASIKTEHTSPQDIIVGTFPDGDISDYLYVDGEYVYEPLPEPEPEPEPPEYVTYDEMEKAIREGVNSYNG